VGSRPPKRLTAVPLDSCRHNSDAVVVISIACNAQRLPRCASSLSLQLSLLWHAADQKQECLSGDRSGPIVAFEIYSAPCVVWE
jgi:hypothetical protein